MAKVFAGRRVSRYQSKNSRQKLRAAVIEELEQRRMLAANVIISEFMASNQSGLTDHAGDHPDWIELHNTGDATANLNNYFLTDDSGNPEKWRFPTGVNLAAGGYLVVFADSSTTSTVTWTTPSPGTEYHTSFSLGASGEYLGLINAADDSVAFQYAPTFPPQTSDISYGLLNSDDPNSTDTFFNVPSPGAKNTPSAAPTTYSVAGKTYTGTLPVTLTDTTPGAQIYYTINGATPTTTVSSTNFLYSGTLSLTNTTMLRTIVAAPTYLTSQVTSQSYIALNATVSTTSTLGSTSVSTFTSNLPIVFVNSFTGFTGSTANAISDTTDGGASISIIDTTNGTASALGTPEYDGRAGFRVRGSTSEGYPKQQYALELWDENNNDNHVSLLGMPADSDWILYAPYTEEIMMQNALAYQWSNEMGHYASKTQYVEMFLNKTNAGTLGSAPALGGTATPTAGADFVGIYILEEKIKVDSTRVNIDEVSSTNPNGGFILNEDRTGGENFFKSSVYGVNLDYDDPGNEVTVNAVPEIKTAWNAFETALNSSDYANPASANYYGNYIDVKSFVDDYLVEEMTRNLDAYWLSTYWTKAADTVVNGTVTQRGLISAGPVWDFNLALGASNYNYASNSDGWNTATELTPFPGTAGVSGFNPQAEYIYRLLQDPNFVQAVSDRWAQLRTTIFTTSQLMSDMDANVAILSNGTTNYPVGPTPAQTPNNPLVRNFIRWSELGTGVTTDGMGDPNGSWIADVNLTKSWLTARVNWMDSQFIPQPTVTAGGTFTGPVAVNMSGNGALTTSDTALINSSSVSKYLVPTSSPGNWYLSGFNTSSWSSFTGIPTWGYDTTTTGSTSNFLPFISSGLNTQTAMDGTTKRQLLTTTTFTLTAAQVSALQSGQMSLILQMKYDDGYIAWINGDRVADANSPENTPTPIFSTSAGSPQTFGNSVTLLNDQNSTTPREYDVSSVASLLVAGANTLAVQGLNYTGSSAGYEDFLLSPQISVRSYNHPSAGTVYYTTDGSDPRTSAGAVSSSAIAYTGPITISANTRINARTLLSNGSWSALSNNLYSFAGADPLRITELMYDPPTPTAQENPGNNFTPQDYEFIEFENTGSSILNLQGYKVTTGIVFTFPNVNLAPGAYAVAVKNLTAFQDRYGMSINVLGAYDSGNLNNGGEPIVLVNGFGSTVQSFDYTNAVNAYPTTTGGGYSLVIKNPLDATLSDWGTAAAWKASGHVDGSPGAAENSDVTPPTVQSISYVSSGNAVHLTFSESVTVASPSGISVTEMISGSPVTPSSTSVIGSGVNVVLPSLADGIYSFLLPAASVDDLNNNAMVSNATFVFLLVADGHTLVLPSTKTTYSVGQMNIGSGSTLDIKNDTIHYAGGDPGLWNGSAYTGVAGLIASGRNGGSWNGTGIISSTTTANVFSTVGLFNGGSSLTIQRTYAGDADLNGIINGDDYFLIDSNAGTVGGSVNYQSGDFNYDGRIDADDYFLIDSNYGKAATALSNGAIVGGSAFVPQQNNGAVFADNSISAYSQLMDDDASSLI